MSTFAPPKTRDTSYWHDEFVAQQVEHNTFNVGVPGSSPGEFTNNRFLKKSRLFCFLASARRVISLVLFRTAQARRRHSVDDDALRATFEPRRVHQQPILEKESVVLFLGIGSSQLLKVFKVIKDFKDLKTKTGEPRKSSCFLVELPGFEPGTTEPKSAVLPLHHSSIRCSKAIAKVM